ncbi:hypothetical protein POTOM_056070 [Populus tomentosa]|uniref:Cytochrome P450 734A1 n=1 Tax=Populus tomentosa TaxID=118781 RepID=A0A8X8C4J4_POPTO|nr:hypothetical protein POTOM_056070 [Populus tomentosa]
MKELFLYYYWHIKLLAISFLALVFLIKIVVLLWCRPRRIEHHFSRQGIRGPPYRFFIGNVKEIVEMMLKASSQPMPFSHNILPRVLSFYHHWKKIYGATFLVWFGPTVRLTVSDPDLIREIFTSKSELYEKVEAHPLVKQLEGDGLLSLKGEKWARHRKIITPTFHMENLKLLVPVVAKSVIDMLEQWSAMTNSDEVEIEVSEWFQTLTEDVITRTAFGSSYEDGKAIFQLQAQQMVLAAVAFRRVLIPDTLILYSELENQRVVVAFSSFHLHAESCYGVQLTMILNESLRLYPPTIATIRRSKVDVELGGYKVPSGTEILIPILALHHDQSIWGNDANEFNPARFSGGVARAAKHHVAFIPFGLGVRTCIGQNLAILQAKLTLAILLQRFSFRLAPSYQHAPTVLMLLYPQYGAPIIFQHLSNP